MPTSEAAAEPRFERPISVFAGPRPTELESADFDSDGHTDLAVASGRYVWVLTGRRAGTFHQGGRVAVGEGFSSMTVGDLNGDRDPDLVGTTPPDRIGVLLGREGTSFGPLQTTAIPPGPSSIAVGDFDRDFRLDAVVAHYNAADVLILRGRGNGAFDSPQSVFVTEPSPYGTSTSVTVGDFDRNADPDLAVLMSQPSDLFVLLGAADAGFGGASRFAVGISNYAYPPPAAFGDFNRDGDLDIATASDDLAVLLGGPGGAFRGRRVVPFAGNAVSAVGVGDFDRDRQDDVALANQNSEDVTVLSGRGNGRFARSLEIPVNENANALAVGDFTRDGDADLAVADTRGVSVLVNATRRCLGRRATLVAGRSGRVTGTRGADVIVGSGGEDVLNGGGGTDRICGGGGDDAIAGGRGADRLAGDRGDDRIVAGPGKDEVDGGTGVDALFGGSGADRVQSRGTRPDHGSCGPDRDELIADERDRFTRCERRIPREVAFDAPRFFKVGNDSQGFLETGDFNRDGDPDIAVVHDDKVSVRLGGPGASLGLKRDFALGSFAHSTLIEELNLDGIPDLVVGRGTSMDVLLGDGAGGFGMPTTFGEQGGGLFGVPDRDQLDSGDYDNDGNPDVALTVPGADEVLVFHGTGTGRFGEPVRVETGHLPAALGSADFDGDGNADLAMGHAFSGDLSILAGDGHRAFGAISGGVTGERPAVIATADFNKDRDPDLAIATRWPTILLGRSGPNFRTPVTYAPASTVLALGEFTGDADVDIATANEGSVSVLAGKKGGSFRRVARLSVTEGPQDLAIADLDRDGRRDLILLTGDIYERGNVQVLLDRSARR